MKPLYFFSIMFFLLSCKHKSSETTNSNLKDTSPVIKENLISDDTPDSIVGSDTVVMPFKDDDTLFYAKVDIDSIEKYYPEINDGGKYDPDIAYFLEGKERQMMNDMQRDNVESFASEAGQDNYYMLYGYFLRKYQGERKFRTQRNRIIEIFRCLNDIHEFFNVGATYFGHQYRRIEGYGEYAISFLANENFNTDYRKNYSIEKQKALFIASLKQFVSDEAEFNTGTQNDYKKERKRKIFAIVDKLNSLITDCFYLQQARRFEYSCY